MTSFPPPVFSHPPILNYAPETVVVRRGGRAELECSVTVGQQYNILSMQPVHAAWIR